MHEFIGLILIFLAATSIGIGLYLVLLGAVGRPLLHQNPDYFLKGKDFMLFPIFFGVGAVLWVMGKIELKEALPGKNRGREGVE